MKNILALLLVCLVCLACVDSGVQETSVQPQPSSSSPVVSNLLAEIRQSPQDFVGELVEIVGYFHGWDLMDEMGEPPPVTRSDWVIADESGALYVTGSLPENLNPAYQEDVGTLIRLVATVAAGQNAPYLQAQSVSVISEK